MHRKRKSTLPDSKNEKSLANTFFSYFCDKMTCTRAYFPSSSPQRDVSTNVSSEFKNYRPVSSLNFISKIIERAVAKQLKEHVGQNDLVNKFQSAYKTGHSTETALLNITNDIHMSLSYDKPVALVLLDLSAAFDTIDHSLESSVLLLSF